MSDGPHRSLPLRAHWQTVAQRAAQAASSPDEVCESLPYALKRDILEAPIKGVRDTMDADSLFPEHRIEQLEALRKSHRSAAANLLIDCAIVAVRDGLTGYEGAETALRHALEETARGAILSIKEHYQREASARDARFVRERVDAAREVGLCGCCRRTSLVRKAASQTFHHPSPAHGR